jgi:hypothetical protein
LAALSFPNLFNRTRSQPHGAYPVAPLRSRTASRPRQDGR